MRTVLISIASLLFGVTILISGHGLTGTLLTLRATLEQYSDIQIGLIMSAYFLGYIVGTFYSPLLVNRIGHIRVFAVAAAVCASLVIAQGLWTSFWFWLLARMIYGICIVGFYLVAESWLNARAGDALRGRVFAVYMLVNLLAMAASQQLLLTGDIHQLKLFAIAAALFSLSLVPVALTRVPEPKPVPEPSINIRHLYKVSPIGLMGCLTSGLAGSAFWALGPLYAHQIGLTTWALATYMSITMVGGALLQWPVGHYSDLHDRRKLLAVVSLGAAITALLSVLTSGLSLLLMFMTMLIYGGLYFAIYPLSVAHANDRSGENGFIQLGSGLLLAYGIGASIGPLLASFLMQWFGPHSLPIYYAACWLSLSLFVFYRIKQTPSIPMTEQTSFEPLIRTSPVAIQTLNTSKTDT